MSLLTSKPDEQFGVENLLEKFIANQLQTGQDLQLSDLRRLSGGLSRENWIFNAAWRDESGSHEVPMIMRRDPEASLLDTERRVEFGLLRALESTPVPAPAAYWLDAEGDWLGSPSLVMERMPGDSELFALNSDRPLTQRATLAREFLKLLVQVQEVDWKSLDVAALLPDPGRMASSVELDRWETELRRNQLEPIPEMDFVMCWLRARAQPSRSTVLVHGDFKPGNALLEGATITALLDWETAHLGDPMEDLGWITNPVRRREHQIRGAWERADIVSAYEEMTGARVDPHQLLWWNVFACWKLAIIVLTGTRVFVDGKFDRIHHSPTWLYRAMLQMMED